MPDKISTEVFFRKVKLDKFIKRVKGESNLDIKTLREATFIGQVLKGVISEIGHNPVKYKQPANFEMLIANISLGLIAFMRASDKKEFPDIE
jgi:hypothetical protein